MTDTYLTPAEIVRLTSRHYAKAQCRWLREHEYVFVLDGNSRPLILRTNPAPVFRMTSVDLLAETEIARRSVSVKKICGIYFLLSGSQIIYVGKSMHVMERICAHIRKSGKAFDAFHYIPVSKGKLDETELEYIRALKPWMNIHGKLRDI